MAPDSTTDVARGTGSWDRRRPAAVIGVALSVLGLLLASVLAGCSSGPSSGSSPVPPVTEPQTPVVYVAMGGMETLNGDRDRDDLADNWPQLVLADHLPPGAVYVNLATEDATARSTRARQVPQALDLKATVATVWLESTDLRLGTSMAEFRDELTAVVEDLQAGGMQVVLLRSGVGLGDPPPLQASVAVVASQTGATLVDLGDISDRFEDSGQRRIADQIGAALAAMPGS